MDLKVLASHKVVSYVCKYINKSEPASEFIDDVYKQFLNQEINNSKTAKSLVTKLLNKTISYVGLLFYFLYCFVYYNIIFTYL